MRVVLEDRRGAQGGHRPLAQGLDGVGLDDAGGQQQQVTRPPDGGESLRHHVVGDVVDGIEETGVVLDGAGVERLHAGPRRQGAAGLVEPDVAVGADAEQLDVDAAGRGDRPVVVAGMPGIEAVGGLHEGVFDVDVRGQFAADGGVVALRVVGAQADVFVEEERAALREGQSLFTVASHQFAVCADGGGSGGEAERGALFDVARHDVGGEQPDFLGGVQDDDLHVSVPFAFPP